MSRSTRSNALARLCRRSTLALCIGAAPSALADEVALPGAWAGDLPEVPANQWKYPMIEKVGPTEYAYNRPHLPPVRLSHDGRIGMRVNKGDDGDVTFFLLRPESLAAPFLLGDAGVEILSQTVLESDSPQRIRPDELISAAPAGVEVGPIKAMTICETGTANPSRCGQDNAHDCYALTIVGVVRQKHADGAPGDLYFASRRVNVKVRSPKTDQATIQSVNVVGAPRFKKFEGFHGAASVEPNITADGRLWIAKFTELGNLPDTAWVWSSPDEDYAHTFESNTRPVYYAYNPDGAACDIDGWATFHPLSYAHVDDAGGEGNRMRDRYGLAAYPIRDSEGEAIPPGEGLIGDQYPWVDREGRNVFVELGGDMLFYEDEDGGFASRYAVRCAATDGDAAGACERSLEKLRDNDEDGNLEFFEKPSQINRNLSVFGSWTHGKVVTLDNLLNYMDYGTNGRDAQQLAMTLYEAGTREGAPVDADNVTDINATGAVVIGHNKPGKQNPDGSVMEGAQIGSIENLFNAFPALRPITPRDVVWLVSKGNGATTEVVFDDYMDPNVLIYSPMNASFKNRSLATRFGAEHAVDGDITNWRDGFRRTSALTGRGFGSKIHLQNAATADVSIAGRAAVNESAFFKLPAFGRASDDVRIEPYALGGVRGKGLWLNEHSTVTYDIPPDAGARDLASAHWYVGVFVDPRGPDGALTGVRTLITFPSGVYIAIKNGTSIVMKARNPDPTKDDETIAFRWLPEPLTHGEWSHLGFQFDPELEEVVLLLDGMRFARVQQFARAVVEPGELVLGGGFRGWIDDFKVIGRTLSPEEQCNHARGTLIGWASADDTWPARRVDSWPHRDLGVPADLQSYACHVDYTSEVGANLGALPEGSTSLRTQMLEMRPLVAGSPRPDESQNAFCQSCHLHRVGPELDSITAFSDSALALGPPDLKMEVDPRRQPSQPPALMHGQVPESMLHLLAPEGFDLGLLDLDAPPLKVDLVLHPAEQE